MRIAAGVFYILYGIVAGFAGVLFFFGMLVGAAVGGGVMEAVMEGLRSAPEDMDERANRHGDYFLDAFLYNWFAWLALVLVVLGVLALFRRGTTAQRIIHLSAVAICLAGLLISVFHFESDITLLAFHGLPAVLAGLVAWRLWQPVPAQSGLRGSDGRRIMETTQSGNDALPTARRGPRSAGLRASEGNR